MSESENATPDVGKGRKQLLTIMAIAMITLGGSYLVFYLASSGGGWGTTNHGEFVTPQTNTADLGWALLPEEARHWFLWVVDEDCDATCQQMVKDLRALHILLSREAGRVRRAYSNLNGDEVELGEPYPKLNRIEVSRQLPKSLRKGVYTVDPNGNLVLFYALDSNPKFILEDLKKMLKVSQIG